MPKCFVPCPLSPHKASLSLCTTKDPRHYRHECGKVLVPSACLCIIVHQLLSTSLVLFPGAKPDATHATLALLVDPRVYKENLLPSGISTKYLTYPSLLNHAIVALITGM